MKRIACLLALVLALSACSAAPGQTTPPPQTTAPVSSPVPQAAAPAEPQPQTAAPAETVPPAVFEAYTVRIEDPDTCIYADPAFVSTVTALVEEAGTYTITEESTDPDGNLWGRLKSGLGWVCLTNPPLAPIYADYASESFNAYHTWWCGEAEYLTSVGFTSAEALTDVKFGLLDWFETESWQMAEVLHTIDILNPDQPFLAQVVFWGDVTTYGISFTDADGAERHYAVSVSGKDGSLICQEYMP